MRAALPFAAALLLASAAWAQAPSPTQLPTQAAPPLPKRLPLVSEVPAHADIIENGAFAPDIDLPRLDSHGGRFKLSAHVSPTGKGDADAAIVAFMASWCGYCQKSLPTLKAVSDQYGGKLAIVAVSIDDSDENAKKEAANLAAAGLDVAVVRADAATLAAWLGNGRGIPRFFFLNKIGEVCVKDKGFGPNVAEMMPRQAGFVLSHPGWVQK